MSENMIQLTENLSIIADGNQYIVFCPRQKADKDGNARTVMDNHISIQTSRPPSATR